MHLARWTILALLLALPVAAQEAAHWPAWRGPLGTGFAPGATPPLEWSDARNVRWKRALPGLGHSTPVLHGRRIFVTSAVPLGEERVPVREVAGAHDNHRFVERQAFQVLALARSDGEILWTRTLCEAVPLEGAHLSASFASASPVVDAERLYVSFGSHGLYALDHDGAVLWERDLGDLDTKHGHGEGSSPALHGDTLIVNWDHEGASFLVALDARTGEERWRVPRDEVTSWASPIVVEVEEEHQVVVSGTGRVRGYALEDGELLWECGGLAHNVVASPLAADGLVFAASSYEKQSMVAIRLAGARGDLTVGSDRLAWVRRRAVPYVPSPLLVDGWLYLLNHYQGVLSRVEAASGAQAERSRRIEGVDEVYASPLGAAGRVYLVDRSGLTVVLEHSPEMRVLARNQLDDSFSASPVAVGDELYLRGARFLWCLGETPATDEER